MFAQQLEAYEQFKKLKVGALFMEMGTGKTKVALELVNYNKVDLLIYLTPFSTKANIEKEFQRWGVNCEYEIVGYETLQASDKEFLRILALLDNKKCFVIADESIFIKNGMTKRFRRAVEIRNKCEYALILNGTPLVKNEWDLYYQMFFLSPLIINLNENDFRDTFFKKIRKKRKGRPEEIFYKFSEVNSEALQKMISPYIFKCDFNAEFKIETERRNIYPSYDTIDEYDLVKEELNELLDDNWKPELIMNLLNKLNHIISCDDRKISELCEYVVGRQVIVFCNYLDEVTKIASKLDCYILTGNVKNRDNILEQFKNDDKPLIMTFGVGSYSLNLQFCNEIVFSSVNFNYGLMEQSAARIKRLGQEEDIKYVYFSVEMGITKILFKSLSRKQTLKKLIDEKIKKGELEKWITKNL